MFFSFRTSGTSNGNKGKKSKSVRQRHLNFEPLENRELLSVTAAEFDAIRTQYADLELGNYADYNVIEIGADNLTDAALRAAIAEAGQTTADDLIVVRTTATQNTITLGGTELSSYINMEQYGSVAIVSLGQEKLTLDANQQSRVFYFGKFSEAALAGLTITNGLLESGSGGGIYNLGALSVTDCTISGNAAKTTNGICGGGIYNRGTLTITNSTISGNSARQSGGGGGIYNYYGSLTVINSTIAENRASGSGGGINNYLGTITVTNSNISDNLCFDTSHGGGGIFNNSGTSTVTNCVLSRNSAYYDGGGIHNFSGTFSVTNSTISGNSAGSDGGGIYGDVSVANSTISKNSAAIGGGIYCGAFAPTWSITNSAISENSASIAGGIYNGGTLTVANSTISKNSSSSSGGGIHNSNEYASLTVTNSVILENSTSGNGGGIYNNNGPLTITNCTISENSAGSGGGIFSSKLFNILNSIITSNRAVNDGGGVYSSNGVTGTNTTFVGNFAYRGGAIFSTKNTTVFNSILVNNHSGYSLSTEIYDISGIVHGANNLTASPFSWSNTSVENFVYNAALPLFVDAKNGNYRLAHNSQVMDSGSSQYAFNAGLHENSFDLAGNPRFSGVSVDIGAYEYSQTTPLVFDTKQTGLLSAQNEYESTRSFNTQSGMKITFNLLDGNFDDITFQLIGPNGTLIPITASGEIVLPETGTYYLKLTSDDEQHYAYQVDLHATPLLIDTPATGHIGGNGSMQLYRLDVTDSKTLSIALEGLSANNKTRIYAKYGSTPTTFDYDYVSSGGFATEKTLTIPKPYTGTWYVMVVGEYVTEQDDYTITASYKDFIVDSVTGYRMDGENAHRVSVTGAGFDRNTTVTLVASNGTRYTAQTTTFESSTVVQATFNAAIPDGNYSVEVDNGGGDPVVVADAIRIESEANAKFDANLVVPSGVRDTGLATLYIEYKNTGNVAVAAPILILRAVSNGREDGRMTLDSNRLATGVWTSATPSGFSNSIQLYASGSQSGILLPGESVEIPVYWAGWNYTLSGGSSIDFTLEVLTPDNTEPLDFVELKQTLKPESYTDAAWNTVWPRLQSLMGSTWGDYVKMLGDIAASLGQSDAQAYGIDELLGVAIQWANDGFNPFGTLVSSTDAAVAGPTAVLSFERSFLGTDIASRFVEGDLGYGWDHNWNWRLDIQGNGDVSLVGPHGIQRLFQADARRAGTFLSQTGDFGSLKLGSNGKYTLTESNGTVLIFSAQGLLETITDLNGNTVTATHTGGKLTKLSDGYGNFLALTYDGSGKITSVADNYGNATSYTYDASGKNLVSVTNSHAQTVTYAYATQTTGALAHTLSQITCADGVKQYFSYDTTGSLCKTWADGVSSVSYVGGNTAKTLLNYGLYEDNTLLQTLRLNKDGQIVRAEDVQGRITLYEYDYYGRVVKITDESGNFSAMEYDKRGNLIRSVNANGEQLRFVYSSKYDNLLAMTDADGNMTVFHYDNKGNLIGMERADGTSSGLAYNSDGTIASATNRRSDSFTYTYDVTTGRLVESRESGSANPTCYEYDGNGNISKIIEPDGGITSMRYDICDRLTRIDYPDGKWIEYTYDSLGLQSSIRSGPDYHVKYTYNSLGLLETVLDATQGDRLVTRYEYDTSGRLSKETQGNGTYTTYAYDTLGFLLAKINYAANGSVLSRFEYTYNQMGLVHAEKNLDGIWTYEYDSAGNITSAIFESVNSLIESQTIVYTYGKGGKLSSITKNGNTENITRNSQGQITRQGDNHFEYDPNGNVTKKTNDQTKDVTDYKYDSQDRLISIEDKNGKKEYEYDALGNQKSIIDNGNRTEVVTTPDGKTLSEKNSNGETAKTIHGTGIIAKTESNGQTSHLVTDGKGSVVAITDSNSTIVNIYSYDPQGGTIYKDEKIVNDMQYQGQYGTKTDENLRRQGNSVSDAQTGNDLTSESWLDNVVKFLFPETYKFGDTFRQYYNDLNTAINEGAEDFGLSLRTPAAKKILELIPEVQKETLKKHLNAMPFLNVSVNNFFRAAHLLTDNFLVDAVLKKTTGWVLSLPGKLATVVSMGDNPVLAIKNGVSTIIQTVQSWVPRSSDPNELLGPGGYGEEGYITVDALLPYRINFENDDTATAPAQRVDIVNRLSDKLDWSTFRMTQFGFGDTIVTIPSDASPFYYEQTVSMELESGKTINVLFSYELVFDTGTLYISFQSLDPDTELPPGAFDGFLPPEDGTGRGMGFVTYTIRAKSDLQTGDTFNNIGEITFDFAETIATNQIDPHDPSQGTDPALEAWLTIDRDRPTSNVIPFETTEVEENFTVRWSGVDVGSGIGSYDVYVSINGGEFVKWLEKTAETNATYTGEIGSIYSFYSVAYDNVGLAEEGVKTAEATVTVTDAISLLATPDCFRVTVQARTTLSLDWSSVEDATGYEVQRLINGNYETIYSGTESEFVDSDLTADTSYTYRVRALGATGSSAYTTDITVSTATTTQGDTPVFVSIEQESNQVTLNWSNLGQDCYYVLFKNGVPVVAEAGVTSYVDTQLATMNTYVIYAYTNDAWTWSPTKVINLGPVKSEIISHEILSNGSIQLNWSHVGENYVVFRNGIPVTTSSLANGTDERPISGANNYVLYMYYTDSNGHGQWIWSETYIVNKSTVQSLSTLDAFWSDYSALPEEDLLSIGGTT